MKRLIYGSVFAAALGLCAIAFSQEPPMQPPPRTAGESMPGPRGPMGGMMTHPGMGMMEPGGMPMRGHGIGMPMMRNPHLAGIMMEMRGEMMRIRGEAMMRQGDVLRRYGERLQKEMPAKGAAQSSGQ